MNDPRDFDATLRSWLQRAAPTEAPDRVLAAALARVGDEPQRQGWLAKRTGGSGRRVILRGAAVTAVIVVAILAGTRLANLGPDAGGSPSPVPSGSSSAEASVMPSEAASVICEAFADGGPMDDVALANLALHPDSWPDVLSDGANRLLALAERASGDERADLLAMATAVENMTIAFVEGASYSFDDFQNLPPETQAALREAVQNAQAALRGAEPAFYRAYAERCDLDLDAPHFVDCGPLDAAACDQAVADLIAHYRQLWEDGYYEAGLPPDLPALGVVFRDVVCPDGTIVRSELFWPAGGSGVSSEECGF